MSGFDSKCLDLARHFNDRNLTEAQLQQLAQHIQDVVEDYFLCLEIDAVQAAEDAAAPASEPEQQELIP